MCNFTKRTPFFEKSGRSLEKQSKTEQKNAESTH